MKKQLKFLAAGIALVAFSATASAQVRDWGCDAETQQAMLEPVSLYQESMKQYKATKDVRYIEEVYPQWKKIVAQCPKQSKNLYINGANILKILFSKSKDAAQRDSLVEELMRMYDTRIANYGEAAEVTAKKALDLEQMLREPALQRYYALYADAVRIGGDQLDAAYVVKFMEATINYVKKGFAEPTLVVDNYDIASDLLDKEVTEWAAKDSVKAAKIRGYIADVENAFSPFASCDQLVEIYSKKFEAAPDDANLLKKITNIMMKKGCTNEQLFFEATEHLYAIEPSPATALRMGQMSYTKNKYSAAVGYLNDAVKGLEETKDRYKAYVLLGLAHAGQNSYSAARSAFYKAAEVDPTKGEPYLQIAQLYAKGARSIADNMGGRSAYWAAVDKAVKAKNVDSSPENIEAANKIIGTFSSYYPKQADAFMAGLENGTSYYVGGWIGETTIVRTR